jgi:hypothetical protein
MRFLFPRSIRFAAVSAIIAFSLVGRIDTAQAQGQDNLLVSPSSYTFTAPFGGGFQSTTFQVTSSAAALSYTLMYQAAANTNWFVAVASSSITPSTITVNVTPGQLPPGTYTGTITLTPSGASTTPVVIPLTLVIAGSNALAVSPTLLSFASTTGSTVSAAQQITVTSATNNLPQA